jgi:copper(I)-binding protein
MALVLVVAAGLLHGATAAAQVVASEAWTRATAAGTTGVGYLVFTNKGDEEAKLLRIISPVSDLALRIHRSTVDSEGVSRMWPVGYLRIPPGESVRFEPNGLHVMFEELKMPFVAGQKVPLQVIFDGQPEFTVMLEVKPLAPVAGADRTSMQRDNAAPDKKK